MMDESVALMLIKRLFSEWTITRDAHGIWWAAVPCKDLDGLLALLAVADPDTAKRAVRLLTENAGQRSPSA